MPRVKKTPQSTTKIEPVIKFRPEPDAVSRLGKDIGARDYPQHYRKQVMHELLDFVLNEPRKLSIEQFAYLKGLRRHMIYDWAKQDKWVSDILDEARSILAQRRYEMALFKEIDKDLFKWNQHKYDPQAIEIHQMWAALKNDEQQTGDIHVHIDEIPTSDRVPLKKEKK